MKEKTYSHHPQTLKYPSSKDYPSQPDGRFSDILPSSDLQLILEDESWNFNPRRKTRTVHIVIPPSLLHQHSAGNPVRQ